ncbi:MAG: DEAD/DEAH box helicase [Nitrososphaerales archaeon]
MSSTQNWIEHRMIKPESIERREYQVALANVALQKNALIVLPTGLGKTTIALLVIAEMLGSNKKGRCLFLAPTKVLVNQHYTSMQKYLQIMDVSMITGENDEWERTRGWDNSVICATPQTTLRDLKRQMIRPEDFSLVVFDEAHRAVGDYAYCGIASLLRDHGVRMIGMTATLPSDRARTEEIVHNLGIKRIEVRDETSTDVRPYVQETEIQWVHVDMPPLLKQMRAHLVSALEKRTGELRQKGILRSAKVSTSELIRARSYLHGNWAVAKILYTAIRISHALNIFDTQGIASFLKFCDRLREKKGYGTKELLVDPKFKEAYEMARGAEMSGIEHPKIAKLAEILSGVDGRILVFTSYRDSVEVLYTKLKEMGLSVGYLIGKAGERGLKQKAQVDAVNRFREGELKILVATQVGEEGLDISECNLVVFYDNVPSAIRFVQRKGRTGRKKAGRVVVLITRDTLDEVYFWISKKKMKDVKSMVGRMNRMMGEGDNDIEKPGSLDIYF